MKSLYNYIIESASKDKSDFAEKATEMYKWWQKEVKDYYDDSHGADESHFKHCPLINKDVKCDCAGFLGAVLCYAGYTENPLQWSVKYGSFNLKKEINNQREGEEIPEYLKDIEYMKDLDGNWHAYKLPSITKWDECKPGDILYSSGHVAILGKNRELMHCSELGQDDRRFRAYWRLEK